MFHRYAHLSKVNVKTGQKITKRDKLGELGGTGGWSPHLHYDCLTYTPSRFTEYVTGKGKQFVLDHYQKPEHTEELPTKFDHYGWNWLDVYSANSYHPGVDLNGPGAGASDLGQDVCSNTGGIVTYVYDGDGTNSGWGKMVVIDSSKIAVGEVKNPEDTSDTTCDCNGLQTLISGLTATIENQKTVINSLTEKNIALKQISEVENISTIKLISIILKRLWEKLMQ